MGCMLRFSLDHHDVHNSYLTQTTTQGHPRQINPPPIEASQTVKGIGNPNQALVPHQKITQAQMEEKRRK